MHLQQVAHMRMIARKLVRARHRLMKGPLRNARHHSRQQALQAAISKAQAVMQQSCSGQGLLCALVFNASQTAQLCRRL